VKDVRWVNSTAIVDAAGEIDLNVSADFQQQLLALLDKRPQRIIINLAGVDYMDSSGVASLVKLLSRIRKAGATLYLVGMTERVRSVFEITRLDSVFDIRAAENEVLSQA
jgi:anti-sigma B factor antagonist